MSQQVARWRLDDRAAALAARETARQQGKVVEMGRERPLPRAPVLGPAPCRGGRSRPTGQCQRAGRARSHRWSCRRRTLRPIVRTRMRCGTLSPTMVVLRCTQQLLFRLKQFDDTPRVKSTTMLGDWYGNIIRMGNRHLLLFISERSRLPVLIPIRQANKLRTVLPDAMSEMLAWMRVPEDVIAEERQQMSQIAYGRTNSRSLLGTMNDFSFGVRVHFMTSREEPLEDIARALAKTPIMPLKGECPIDLTRATFGLERLSRLDL